MGGIPDLRRDPHDQTRLVQPQGENRIVSSASSYRHADVFCLRPKKANASVMNGCYFFAYRLVYRCAVEDRNS